jgi:hypothetical protein
MTQNDRIAAMNDEELNQKIRDFYQSIGLSDDQLAEMLAKRPGKEAIPFYRSVWFSYAAAACIAFGIVSVVFDGGNLPEKRNGDLLADQVIRIYDRHFDPEVYSEDLPSIEQGLHLANFSILPSNRVPVNGYRVVGGRNCRFKGIHAVHLILTDPVSGRESCLYVLPNAKELETVQERSVDVGSHHVSMWRDQGRLFVLYDPER